MGWFVWSRCPQFRLRAIGLAMVLGALPACDAGSDAAADAAAMATDGALAEDAARTADAGPAADAGRDAVPAPDAAQPRDAARDVAPGADANDVVDAQVEGSDAAPDAAAPDAAIGLTCPPPAPHGVAIGDRIPSFSLPDCDGTLHDLQSLCGQPGFVFEFAAWCPPCRQFAREFNAFWGQFPEAAGFVIVSATENFGPPDAASCRAIRDQYALPVPVLYDAEGRFAATFGVPQNDMAFVTGPDGTLQFKAHYSSRAQKEQALRAASAE